MALIPDNIEKIFYEHPNIGRDELARKADISNQRARFYVQLYRELHKKATLVGTGIGAWDIHYPYYDKASINVLIEAIKIIHPTHFVFGGDNMDFSCISHHNKGKYRLLENTRLKKDYKGFQKDILDRVNNALSARCKRYFIMGNHEEWVNMLINDQPQLEGMVEIENNLDLKGYEIIPFNGALTLGEMTFIHGLYTNKYVAEKHLRVYQKMVFFGHTHTNQVYTSVTPLNTLPKQGVNVGCLANLNAGYLKGKPNKWVHQILVWHMFSDGTFVYETPIILNGRTVINGRVVDGNER